MDESLSSRLRIATLAFAYALVYALAVTALATAGALVLGIATGGGLVRAKIFLFVAGWAMMAYAVVRLWPKNPSDVGGSAEPIDPGSGTIPATGPESRFQATLRDLPPARWLPALPPEQRITVPGKLFLGSLLVLLTSFLMETVFGVA
jgi:hypothetical protein